MPPGAFNGSVNADGVSFSVDGNTWFPILSFTGANSTAAYQSWAFNLRARPPASA